MTCKNCDKPISATEFEYQGEPYVVWAHEDNHTVCNWREDMEPTPIVATPKAA